MKGTIRLIVGLLITYGAVGTMDYDPNADVVTQMLVAGLGLVTMLWGTIAMNREAV